MTDDMTFAVVDIVQHGLSDWGAARGAGSDA